MSRFPNIRMRRRRQSQWLLDSFAETVLNPKDFILPLFVTDDKEQEIKSMPGIWHHTIDSLIVIAKKAYCSGIRSLLLFPVVPRSQKTDCASQAWSDSNLISRAVKALKQEVPEIGVIVDVALDPYTSHGHDGLLNKQGLVDNDLTLEALCKQSLSLASAGADVVAPSDMMDGRVAKIRETLDLSGYSNVLILSYSAKYNSKLYAPFRGAIGSSKQLGKKDKSSYQQDIRNADEAIREINLDIDEGADWLMIKPGMTNLDIISRASKSCLLPIVAYQVSGEYSMIYHFAKNSGQDFIEMQYEFLISLKRSGAMHIVCYNAIEVIEFLKNL